MYYYIKVSSDVYGPLLTSLGAVGSKLALYPIDTLRTLQQTSTSFSYILPIQRYYRGVWPATALTTPAFTIYMVSYRQCKQELTPYLGESAFSNYVISGAMAEITSSFIWTPMEVIKGRMQIKEGEAKASTWNLVKQIYRKEGVRGYFRGYWMGIAVFLPHSVVWWTTYEQAKKYYGREEELGPLEYGVSSALASTSGAVASNFLDVVKTRQQLAVADEISCLRPDDKFGVFRVARNLVREVGLFRALFKGLHIRLTHSLPSSVLAMVIIETINPDSSKIKEVRVMGDLDT